MYGSGPGWRQEAQAVADSSGRFKSLAEAAPCLAHAYPVSEQTVAMTEIALQLARKFQPPLPRQRTDGDADHADARLSHCSSILHKRGATL